MGVAGGKSKTPHSGIKQDQTWSFSKTTNSCFYKGDLSLFGNFLYANSRAFIL
jgi:hypothetical protein